MDIEVIKGIFKENLMIGLALGMSSWFLTWGLNRVYLFWKTFLRG